MQVSTYLKMNYDELAKEIDKQNKRIKSSQETIKLLKKLQVAETANMVQKKAESAQNSESLRFEEIRFREKGNQ